MPAIRPFQTQPVPLEGLGALPDALDGSWGSNRQSPGPVPVHRLQ